MLRTEMCDKKTRSQKTGVRMYETVNSFQSTVHGPQPFFSQLMADNGKLLTEKKLTTID